MNILIFFSKIPSNHKKGSLQIIRTFFNFCRFFHFFFNPKISNLSRAKAPNFQNNVIPGMKNALIGGKKVKTQLSRRRGYRKIQHERYLISQKL